jgi:hypothetical protein
VLAVIVNLALAVGDFHAQGNGGVLGDFHDGSGKSMEAGRLAVRCWRVNCVPRSSVVLPAAGVRCALPAGGKAGLGGLRADRAACGWVFCFSGWICGKICQEITKLAPQ